MSKLQTSETKPIQRNGKSDRIDKVESQFNSKISEIKNSRLDENEARGNIENFIGAIEIPVGLVGPLKLNNLDEKLYAPIATSEGALVASMNRGSFAINLAGGVNSYVKRQRMTRAPMFCMNNLEDAKLFESWVNANFNSIKSETKKYSRHANLIDINTEVLGRNVHLRFSYETGDASGQNMTTTCTWHACLWIKENYNHTSRSAIDNFVLEANGASDKKISKHNHINGRGISVTVEVEIDEKIIRKVLKTTSQEIFDLYCKSFAMTKMDGMIGYNVNVANTVAAFFASTGQDLACIHESSVAILQFEKTNDGLYCSLTIPTLVIGTVGGGTGLPGARQVLESMNCYGEGKVERFAQVIAGFALGLELSTISAITSGQFAQAHERLGRNRPVIHISQNELNLEFFQANINKKFKSIKSTQVTGLKNGIITEVTSRVSEKLIGFIPFTGVINDKTRDIIIKSKPLDREVFLGFEVMASMTNQKLANAFKEYRNLSDFAHGHLTEIHAYRHLMKTHQKNIPFIYGDYINVDREAYFICQELLNKDDVRLFNTEKDLSVWNLNDKSKCIDAMASIHREYHGKEIENIKQYETSPKRQAFRNAFIEHFEQMLNCPLNFEQLNIFKTLIDKDDKRTQILEFAPKTLIHNDLNPRNICLKSDGTPCFYDWELARINYPHKDLMEFLIFTIDEYENPMSYIFQHFETFNMNNESKFSKNEWLSLSLVAIEEYILDRLPFYIVGSEMHGYSFLQTIIKNSFRLWSQLTSKD